MANTISVDELAEHLDEILNRIRDSGESFVIQCNGEKIARFDPIGQEVVTARELVRRIGDLEMPGEGFADDLEAIHDSQSKVEPPAWS